jgi:hypothetical protein
MTVGFAQQTFLTPAGVSPPPYDWAAFWLVPAAVSVITVVLFQISFKAPRAKTTYVEPSAA